MASLPDTRYSLLARLAEPADAEAWSEFVAIYEEAIFRYSRNRGLQDADAQEVVQQVLLAVHQAIGDWKPSGRAGSFRTWLVQSAHRSCLKMLRGRAKCDRATGGTSMVQHLAAVADCDSTQATDDLDWQKWAFSWAAALVQRDIEPVTWQAFWLTAVDGLPAAEVAARVNLKIGSVYAAKCRVLARIREQIQKLSRERL